jgi:UTP--glucose-1-phosphate uridylyltransferase
VPFVDLDSRHFKLVKDFDARFADGVPSLREAERLVVNGDWTFAAGVTVAGDVVLEDQGPGSRVESGTTLR